MHKDGWWTIREKWEAQIEVEFRERFPEYAGGRHEVCEDGSVYLGNLAWLPKESVTPWVNP